MYQFFTSCTNLASALMNTSQNIFFLNSGSLKATNPQGRVSLFIHNFLVLSTAKIINFLLNSPTLSNFSIKTINLFNVPPSSAPISLMSLHLSVRIQEGEGKECQERGINSEDFCDRAWRCRFLGIALSDGNTGGITSFIRL